VQNDRRITQTPNVEMAVFFKDRVLQALISLELFVRHRNVDGEDREHCSRLRESAQRLRRSSVAWLERDRRLHCVRRKYDAPAASLLRHDHCRRRMDGKIRDSMAALSQAQPCIHPKSIY